MTYILQLDKMLAIYIYISQQIIKAYIPFHGLYKTLHPFSNTRVQFPHNISMQYTLMLAKPVSLLIDTIMMLKKPYQEEQILSNT